MNTDLTPDVHAGYDDATSGLPWGQRGTGIFAIAYDVGYYLGSRPRGAYGRPSSASAGRGKRRVRVKWATAGDLVWEWINRTTIRRA